MNAVGHGFLIIVGSSADVRHTMLSSDSPFKQVRAPKMLENIGRDSTLEDPGCIISCPSRKSRHRKDRQEGDSDLFEDKLSSRMKTVSRAPCALVSKLSLVNPKTCHPSSFELGVRASK